MFDAMVLQMTIRGQFWAKGGVLGTHTCTSSATLPASALFGHFNARKGLIASARSLAARGQRHGGAELEQRSDHDAVEQQATGRGGRHIAGVAGK